MCTDVTIESVSCFSPFSGNSHVGVRPMHDSEHVLIRMPTSIVQSDPEQRHVCCYRIERCGYAFHRW